MVKVDGGKATIDYINANIHNKEKQINEVDIMLHNLNIIFPDMEQRFSNEDLQELTELFSNTSMNLENKIIILSIYLKLVAQNLKKHGRLDEKGAADFIFNQIQQVIINYKNTTQISINKEISSLANQCYNQKIRLNDSDYKKLHSSI